MSQPPPNPAQRNMIQTIQPAQATRLLEALKEELAKAKAAGQDTTRARQHYARAEQIKQVLVDYRKQQQQKQAAAARAATAGNFSGAAATPGGTPGGPQIGGPSTPSTVPVSAPAHTNTAQFHSSTAGTRPGTSGFAAGSNAMANSGQTPGPSTMNNVNQQQHQQQQQQQQQPQPQNQPQPQPQPQAPPRSGIYATTQMPTTLPEGLAQPPQQAQQQQPQQPRPASVTPGVTTEKYNRVRSSLQDLERKIRTFEAGKRADMNAEENTQFENQLRELKLKFAQYSKFALYMQNQLLELARASGASAALMGGSPVPRTGTPGAANVGPTTGPSVGTPGPVQATPAASGPVPSSINQLLGPALVQGPGIHTPVITNALQVASNANSNVHAGPGPGPGHSVGGISDNVHMGGAGMPMKNGSRGPSPSVKEPTVPGVNLSLITKPSVPSIPILSTINVKPHNPITLKPGANNVRPTLTAGGSSGLGQVVNSPAMMRMPTFDMASTGPIQDNGGRVLTKRKLTELVNTIGADEGDGKTTIDGDVEELLLDLADEFVSSVTTFACRLAKHRKTDAIDVRDVQLHLERNWNIRIPGHATDEIRSMRKWQPSSTYTQKVSGVDIVKAVNGNIN